MPPPPPARRPRAPPPGGPAAPVPPPPPRGRPPAPPGPRGARSDSPSRSKTRPPRSGFPRTLRPRGGAGLPPRPATRAVGDSASGRAPLGPGGLLRVTPPELLEHPAEGDPAPTQEDHGVEPEVGHLFHEAGIPLALRCRPDHLLRFLPDLQADLRLPFLEQACDVRPRRRLRLPGLDHALDEVEDRRALERLGSL